ncbi:MAG: gamma-glutamyl-gamma-aminobutyrate hydrolase family protein [Nocardioidaceae bacterium]|nr:gamma-glutamyl-gamma-aminobutyrate hydrolase family protein [Nocardioidaceae bacterium]
MSRPVIGITSYVESASWGAWQDVRAVLVQEAYVAHLFHAGAIPVLLPPLLEGATADDAEAVLSRLDGLVLAGGSDVESARYGQPPHPLAQQPRPERDATELLLAAVARDRLPVLGVCRGMQVMAVAAGGELEQHLPDRLGHLGHAPAPATYGLRTVLPKQGSLLESITGGQFEVRCYHHQGVISYPTYEATGLSDDGVVEAIESPGARFHLGVQWHPEKSQDNRLFAALVAAARGRLVSR